MGTPDVNFQARNMNLPRGEAVGVTADLPAIFDLEKLSRTTT
jgi:hypothetical protein